MPWNLPLPIVLAAVLAVAVSISYATRQWWRSMARLVLTDAEWVVLGKLVAILGFLMLLVYANIATEFPADQFIYGRF